MAIPRLAQTFSANALGRAVQALNPIISVPLFLSAWGATGYGEWLLIATIPTYIIRFADIGLPTVASNEMTMLVSKEDRDEALIVFQSAWVLVTAVSVLMVALASTVAWLVPVSSVFNMSSISDSEFFLVLIFLLVGMFASQQVILSASGLRCEGAFPLQALLITLTNTADLFVVVSLLVVGSSPVEVAAGMAGVRCLALIVTVGAVRKVAPWLKWRIDNASSTTIRRLFKPAISFMGIEVNHALSVQGVLLALGAALGPAAVAVFSATRTMTNSVKQVMRLVNQSIWPEITESFGAGRIAKAQMLHRGAVMVSGWMGFIALLILALCGPYLFDVWVGGEVAFEGILFYALVLSTMASVLGYTSSVVHVAVNQHKKLAIFQIVNSATVLVLVLLIAPVGEFPAVGAILIISEVVAGIWIINQSARILGDDLAGLLTDTLNPSQAYRAIIRSI